jgi:hypothetical protein
MTMDELEWSQPLMKVYMSTKNQLIGNHICFTLAEIFP